MLWHIRRLESVGAVACRLVFHEHLGIGKQLDNRLYQATFYIWLLAGNTNVVELVQHRFLSSCIFLSLNQKFQEVLVDEIKYALWTLKP